MKFLQDTYQVIKEKFNKFGWDDDAINATKTVAKNLGISPADLMAVMHFESGMNPKAVNPYSGASGLIQFMPATAKGLGTSVESIRRMGIDSQLHYVYKYLLPYKGRMKDLADVYLAVFFPAAIGKPNSYALQTKRLSAGLIAKQNPVFDTNKDGKITKGEILAIIGKKAERAGFRSKIGPIAMGLVLALGVFFLTRRK